MSRTAMMMICRALQRAFEPVPLARGESPDAPCRKLRGSWAEWDGRLPYWTAGFK